jgi:hypothetical protein
LPLNAAFFTASLRPLKVCAGTAVPRESNDLGNGEVSFFLGHVHGLADGRQRTDAVKQHVAGRSRYAKEVLLLLRGRRGRLGLVFRPNVNLDRTRPLRIQFGAELGDLLLPSFETCMEGLDQCFAVVVVRDGVGPRLGLRRGPLRGLYGLRGRCGLRLGHERELGQRRNLRHGFDGDGLRHRRRDLEGLDDRRMKLHRLGDRLRSLRNRQCLRFRRGRELERRRAFRGRLGHRNAKFDVLGNGLSSLSQGCRLRVEPGRRLGVGFGLERSQWR